MLVKGLVFSSCTAMDTFINNLFDCVISLIRIDPCEWSDSIIRFSFGRKSSVSVGSVSKDALKALWNCKSVSMGIGIDPCELSIFDYSIGSFSIVDWNQHGLGGFGRHGFHQFDYLHRSLLGFFQIYWGRRTSRKYHHNAKSNAWEISLAQTEGIDSVETRPFQRGALWNTRIT